MLRVFLVSVFLCLSASTGVADVLIDVGGRTVNVHVPPSYSPATPIPVVMLLHAYGGTGAIQEGYMHFEPLADSEGFLYLHPDGTTDLLGYQFWNATDACCDDYGSGVDDVAFLSAVLDEVEAQFNVDPRRIHLIGHSNGGFMAYRMACDHAERIAAIASLAGVTWFDPLDCNASEPVHVLQIHGTADSTVLYAGGSFGGVPYPGAVETAQAWASTAGCSPAPESSAPNLDLEASLPGNETTVSRYATGCSAGGSAELWTVVGAEHSLSLSDDFSSLVIAHLLAHPKPAAPAAVPLVTDRRWLVAALIVSGLGVALRSRRAPAP